MMKLAIILIVLLLVSFQAY
ncbi:type I toxin-antitoxin system Ibs family toxin [Escherichia coli]|nr:type I toxin-antitoxin system Ibs family toxin [Escherichia coli]EEZ7063933.1 type I toxin-antitoxin system Ibs family toxin [Escherichia coli O17]EFN8157736.1 type I toxin-antitoxin system Ibs family toxin [Escherichia coli]EKK2855801.1 type I toxin-antitoxin system Ibs family toxin [Escherichia coli]MBC0683856.1 type I toxin-antitoxin system Ibs family toxin [Escherichia coli]MBC0905426.1 type I toxin-antitoxin system Ibs family toxin [Escherichia coli]